MKMCALKRTESVGIIFNWRMQAQPPAPPSLWLYDPDRKRRVALDLAHPPPGLIDLQAEPWRDNLDGLATFINRRLTVADSPVRLEKKEGRGYGLVAIRDIPQQSGARATIITDYGGVIVDSAAPVGDYVISGNARSWDAGRFFWPETVGRFINEPPHAEKWLVNVEPRVAGDRYYFIPIARGIRQGEELFLDYGHEYTRPWGWNAILARGDREEMDRLKQSFQKQLRHFERQLRSLSKLGSAQFVPADDPERLFWQSKAAAVKEALVQVDARLASLPGGAPPRPPCQLCGAPGRLAKWGRAFCSTECQGAFGRLFGLE